MQELDSRAIVDAYGNAVRDLVIKTDRQMHLSEEEKCLIVDAAFSGLHKILNKRRKKLMGNTARHRFE